ncbi:MAG: sigma-54 dependent transcriptional regulator [Candidatus Polarisedimenticolaceae bacterium]|nr:sigma-54 dependent transcriptional regulator [Candidatus Polarisedimenticolaceae bacterium]
MSQPLVLIVDDEPDICELLEITLIRMGIATHKALDIKAAEQLLTQHKFDLCLSDMRLPDGDGIDLVRKISTEYPDTPVAMITAHGNMESAVNALKAGAFDFVSKPVDLQVLRQLVTKALKLKAPSGSPAVERAPDASESLLGRSKVVENMRRMIGKLARSQAPVYISGESGSGKELAAQLIHAQGPRAEHAFVAVNCGAIPQELVESEFFGHTKGSFTGAVADKEGLFLAADGGTLFLDEVADLPLAMQVKLLRAIQEKRIRPVGSTKELSVDVRIISATHKKLSKMVENGEFRQDLFYRINVIELPVPALRERREDIHLLTDYVLNRLAVESAGVRTTISPAAMARLEGYNFPGNIRELENILQRASTLCEDEVIEMMDLQLPEQRKRPREIDEQHPLGNLLGDTEKQAIIQALEEMRWNRTAAAKKLGITLRALRYRLSKLGIE